MYYFIVNPVGGNGSSIRIYRQISNKLTKLGIAHSVAFTTKENGADKIAASLTAPKGDALKKIVLIGGDGTYNDFLRGVQDFDSFELGLIPGGSGNDFARVAKLSKKKYVELDKILAGTFRRTVDFIQTGDKRSLNVAGTGLDVQVLIEAAKLKGEGKINYLRALIRVLKNFKTYKLRINVDGKEIIRDCIMAGVANGTCIGGGMKFSPRSDISDGLLNVVVVSMPKDGKVFPVLPKFLSGKHIDMDFCEEFLAEKVSISGAEESVPVQLDGEIYFDHTLDCQIVKGRLKLLN